MPTFSSKTADYAVCGPQSAATDLKMPLKMPANETKMLDFQLS